MAIFFKLKLTDSKHVEFMFICLRKKDLTHFKSARAFILRLPGNKHHKNQKYEDQAA